MTAVPRAVLPVSRSELLPGRRRQPASARQRTATPGRAAATSESRTVPGPEVSADTVVLLEVSESAAKQVLHARAGEVSAKMDSEARLHCICAYFLVQWR